MEFDTNILLEMGFSRQNLTEVTETTVDVIRFKESIKKLVASSCLGIDIPSVQLDLYRTYGTVYTRIDAERIFDYLVDLNFIQIRGGGRLALHTLECIIYQKKVNLYSVSNFYTLSEKDDEKGNSDVR